MSTVVVTGAEGFIGAPLSVLLRSHGHRVIATIRSEAGRPAPNGIELHATGDLDSHPDWSAVLTGTECVIHLAGRAHVTRETSTDSAAAFRRTNVDATARLFRASQRAGVRRFVFVSSIGVLGVASGEQPFNAASRPNPTEAYAISKWEAEQELNRLAEVGPTELVIVRPTLVCGPRAKGNFDRLARLVKRGLPLPLASVHGRRNFVGVRNLCELLELCATHPAATHRTYLAADPEIYTTPQLIRAIADALELKAHLLPCPPALLRLAGAALGMRSEVQRLTDSLLVDASGARAELGWHSTRPLDDEITAMAQATVKSPDPPSWS